MLNNQMVFRILKISTSYINTSWHSFSVSLASEKVTIKERINCIPRKINVQTNLRFYHQFRILFKLIGCFMALGGWRGQENLLYNYLIYDQNISKTHVFIVKCVSS